MSQHQLQIVLRAIEGLVSDDFCEELAMRIACGEKRFALNETEQMAYDKLTAVYTLSHAFDPSHSCYHVHQDWRDSLGDYIPHEVRRNWGAPEIREVEP